VNLGAREVALLERLVHAEEREPNQLFVTVYTSAGTAIAHKGMDRKQEYGDDEAALMGLEAAGLLLVETYDKGRPKAFHLPSSARAELDEARAEQNAAEERAARKEAARDFAPLGFVDLLQAMIDAHRVKPSEAFIVFDTYPNRMIGHGGLPKPGVTFEGVTLARLEHSGAVERGSHNYDLYLLPRAAEVLAEERRLMGLETPEQRVEATARRIDSAGSLVAAIVAAATFALFAWAYLNREAVATGFGWQDGGAGLEAVAAILGLSGLGVAGLAFIYGRWGARALLRWLFDPRRSPDR